MFINEPESSESLTIGYQQNISVLFVILTIGLLFPVFFSLISVQKFISSSVKTVYQLNGDRHKIQAVTIAYKLFLLDLFPQPEYEKFGVRSLLNRLLE